MGVVVALTTNREPTRAEAEFKMVASGERRPDRWVSNLNALTVVTLE